MKNILAVILALVTLLGACGCEARIDGGSPQLDVYFFDAGKADAILIRTESHTVLIDAGEQSFGKTIVKYLESEEIGKIDYLIITHFDKDHVGGAAKVINSFDIGMVYVSNCPQESSEYDKFIRACDSLGIEPEVLRENTEFTLDGAEFTIYPPQSESYAVSPSNNSSLITAVHYKNTSFLFTGDAEDAELSQFLNSLSEHFDVVKLPHHGEWQNTLPSLSESTTPQYAVITSSDSDKESAETVTLFEENGAAVYLTRQGAIHFYSDGKRIKAER